MTDHPSRPDHWLLLRGFSRDQRHWGSFRETYGEALGVEVACLDAPGFGTEHTRRSPARVAGITEDLRRRFEGIRGEHRWGLFGISLGGMVAQDWVHRHPDDFERCVLVTTTPGNVWPPRMRLSVGKAPSAVAGFLRGPAARERTAITVSRNRIDGDLDALVESWIGYQREAPTRFANVAAQAAAAVSFRGPNHLAVPTLVLGSRADRLVPPACSEQLAARLSAPMRMHDTAGHDVPADDPAWVCEQIVEWLDADPSTPS